MAPIAVGIFALKYEMVPGSQVREFFHSPCIFRRAWCRGITTFSAYGLQDGREELPSTVVAKGIRKHGLG